MLEIFKKIALKTGAFLKTDIRYILKQGSWLAGGEAINNVLSVALIIAFANLLAPTTYGIYKYILSIYGIFALFGLSGAGQAIIKSTAEGNEGIYKPALKAQRKWALLGSIATVSIAVYYLSKGNDIFGYSFLLAAIVLPFFESQNTYQHVLAGKKRFDLQTKYYTGSRIISTVVLILVLFFTDNVIALLFAYFAPYILANLFFEHLALKKVELNQSFDPEAISYMKHLSLIGAISFSVNYLDSIIVFQLLGPLQLAVFAIATAPATRFQSFLGIIPDISLPKFAERPIEEIRDTLIPKAIKSMLICAILVVLYMIAVPYFFKWFLPQYTDAIFFAQILAIQFIWYPFALLARVLVIKAPTKQIYYYNITESVLQLIVMFLGIYLFGLAGAIGGRIATSVLGNVVLYYYFKKL